MNSYFLRMGLIPFWVFWLAWFIWVEGFLTFRRVMSSLSWLIQVESWENCPYCASWLPCPIHAIWVSCLQLPKLPYCSLPPSLVRSGHSSSIPLRRFSVFKQSTLNLTLYALRPLFWAECHLPTGGQGVWRPGLHTPRLGNFGVRSCRALGLFRLYLELTGMVLWLAGSGHGKFL